MVIWGMESYPSQAGNCIAVLFLKQENHVQTKHILVFFPSPLIKTTHFLTDKKKTNFLLFLNFHGKLYTIFFYQFSSYYGTRWYSKVFPDVSNMDTDSGYFYLLKTSNTKVATVSYFHFAIGPSIWTMNQRKFCTKLIHSYRCKQGKRRKTKFGKAFSCSKTFLKKRWGKKDFLKNTCQVKSYTSDSRHLQADSRQTSSTLNSKGNTLGHRYFGSFNLGLGLPSFISGIATDNSEPTGNCWGISKVDGLSAAWFITSMSISLHSAAFKQINNKVSVWHRELDYLFCSKMIPHIK